MIALFDSGYGGLTILKPMMEALPQYQYLYLGDNARAPYGGRSQEMVQKFSEEAVEYLFERGAKLIIFACNTASSLALPHVQAKYLNGAAEKERKVLGVLRPLAEEAVKLTKNNTVGVVGTRGTVASGAYNREIKKIDPMVKVHSKACPLLVPFIEEGWHQKPECNSILKKYLRPLKSTNLDTLILGCTHYPILINQFRKKMGSRVHIPCPGKIVANSLKQYLTNHPEIASQLTSQKIPTTTAPTLTANCQFLTTDCPDRFKTFAEKYLGRKIKLPEKVEV